MTTTKTEESSAPRVESIRIGALVESLKYETARVPNTTSTIATARLPNGFVVAVGHSACVSPANFDAELGKKYAIEDAMSKSMQALWQFEGYVLARELAAEASPIVGQVHPNQALPHKTLDQFNTDRAQLAALGEQSKGPGYSTYENAPMKEMAQPLPHQQRVIEEHRDLVAKLDKLRPFMATAMFKQLAPAEQLRMTQQHEVMEQYATILFERIEAF